MTSIKKVLSSHTPALEQEVVEYLEGLIKNAIEDDEDPAIVAETLVEFLSQDECESILSLFPSKSTKKKPKSPAAISQLISPLSLQEEEPVEMQASGPETTKKEPSAQVSKKAQRKERRLAKKTGRKAKVAPDVQEEKELLDDHASAWEECKKEGALWGGRGHGGRGLRITGDNLQSIHLPSVSLVYLGNELLADSPMYIVQGKRYGILGRNGVGKSTLLKQLAAGAIPGMPRNMRILLVQQQIQGRVDQTTLEALVEADVDRQMLLEEQEKVEQDLEAGIDLEKNAERLGDIVAELDAIDADSADERALEILKGLSFTKPMVEGPTASLSGGWRMRLALAQALFVRNSDLILLDECTNHLDLHGMDWLIQYLTTKSNHTLLIVSHDRGFLDAVCTDMIVMEHQKLAYHVGNYSEYRRQMDEKAARQAQILDASERQRAKAVAFVQKQSNNKKSTDPNKQRQAKMIKEKKMDRIGMYREDGKKFKNFSLSKMSADAVRLAEKVHIERDDPTLKLRFPNPTFPPSLASENSTLVRMENVNFGYEKDADFLLENFTLYLTRASKVAVVGKNGAGKTTLVRLITGEIEKAGRLDGEIWRYPGLRVGHISQYSVEELEEFKTMTVVQYAEKKFASGRASSKIIAEASGNVRKYLGSFGLGGTHAHRAIGTLSGGERMRLCFATAMADEPQLLLLDESTNHVDLETLDSMSQALADYTGAVLMVSHNQAFLSGFCNELWVVEDGKLEINHSDTESFDDLFSNYRSHILSGSSASARMQQRKVRATMARQAKQHSTNARANTTMLT
ncbi:unnamed protein product [Cylindrotheca closterium]|uniref:ABC transporter domain-containing protein n=1 Tax=Cylindrotheca closterium TaxID=2856 RepID=A0AAD2G264_9STRA|nr:unnamed protein product [Cylindrotheca closterium]